MDREDDVISISVAPTEDDGLEDDAVEEEQGVVFSPAPLQHAEDDEGAEEDDSEAPAAAAAPARAPRRTRNRQPNYTGADPAGVAKPGGHKRGSGKAKKPKAKTAKKKGRAPPVLSDDPVEVLRHQEEWDVRTEGPKLSAAETPLSANNKYRDYDFFETASLGASYDESDSSRVTYSVGDVVTVMYTRNDPKVVSPDMKDKAVARIYAICQEKKTGIIRMVAQWGWFWADMLVSHKPDVPALDDDLRSSKEVFWEAEVGAWPFQNLRPLVEREIASNVVPVHNIIGPCAVRHRDEFPTEQALNEWLEQPATYFCRYSIQPNFIGLLRFESLPFSAAAAAAADPDAAGPSTAVPLPPTVQREYLRLDPAQLTMVDVFCGSGSVSDAAIDEGFQVRFGVELEPSALKVYQANMAARGAGNAARRRMSVRQFVEAVERGDPGVPRPGEVGLLHLSPPCQALCPGNAHKGLDRYYKELVPLLDLTRRLILALRPYYVTLEEVQGFMYARLPRKQFTNRPGAEKTAAGQGDSADDELVEDDIVDEEAADKDDQDGEDEPEEAPPGTDPQTAAITRVPVRPWLRVIPAMLQGDYQIDIRLLNAAHYGVPQNRERLIVFAALRGYELPTPPPPRYHGVARVTCFREDPKLRMIDKWVEIRVQSDESMPLAVTAAEAIDDLPRMLLPGDANGEYDETMEVLETYAPRVPGAVSRFSLYMHEGRLRKDTQGRTIPMEAPEHLCNHDRPKGEKGKQTMVDEPFRTIVGGDDIRMRPIHYAELRALSVHERARAQSFGDRMHLWGKQQERMKIVGNAVPMLMARAITGQVAVAATGQPSTAPPIPNLKGFVDQDGNEVPVPQITCIYAARKGKRKADKIEACIPDDSETVNAAENDEDEDEDAPETMLTPKNRAAPSSGRRPPQSPESAGSADVVEARLRKRRRPGQEFAETFKAHPITFFCSPQKGSPGETQGSAEEESAEPRTPEDEVVDMVGVEEEDAGASVHAGGAGGAGSGDDDDDDVEVEDEEEEEEEEVAAPAAAANATAAAMVPVKREPSSDQTKLSEGEPEVIDLTGDSDDD